MYGGQKKCDKQFESDQIFLHACDSIFGDRKTACLHHIKRGWDYFYLNVLDTSMMRFNQAWLLDSTNADIYWGFGNILGTQKKFNESLSFFDMSIRLNPNNSNVWECAATSHGQIFFQTKDITHLNMAIDYLKKSIQLDPTNAKVYGALTASYSYFIQGDSAKKYLELTDKLDPAAINPEVRRVVTGK
jgi:tetratricopeptide (TPR) repeat protein